MAEPFRHWAVYELGKWRVDIVSFTLAETPLKSLRKPLWFWVNALGVKFWFESWIEMFILSERESTEEEIIPIWNGNSADDWTGSSDGAEVAFFLKGSSCILGRSPLGIRPSGREQLILFISFDSFLVGKRPWFYIADPALDYSFRKKKTELRCGLLDDLFHVHEESGTILGGK